MSDCYCDYDPPEFYHSELRKARKPHKCVECTGHALPGEKYEYVRGKWDGTIWTFKTCPRCLDLAQWVKNNVPCFCPAHGGMDEAMQDAIDAAYDRARSEVTGLWFGFHRRKIQRRRFNAEHRVQS